MPKPFALAVFGFKGSGKTRIAEYLISSLVKDGLRVATFKHIHHPGFTIDTKGTDTWRHAKAGAHLVVSVSDSEIALILKRYTAMEGLTSLLGLIESFSIDIAILEGFHRMLGRSKEVHKILVARRPQDLQDLLLGTEQPIVAVVAYFQPQPGLNLPAPLVRGGDEQTLLTLVKQAYLRYKATTPP